MKIIGGKFKNRNIYMLKGTRPTQHIVRKSLFDILGQDLSGLNFLELFAGSGAMALEALSRGAEKVVMVEKDPRCCAVIQENIGKLALDQDPSEAFDYQLIQQDAFLATKMLHEEQSMFDIVYCDPPYGRGHAKKILKTLEAYDIVQPHCTLIIQHDKKEPLPEQLGRFSLLRQKIYGHSQVSIFKKTIDTVWNRDFH